MKRSFLLSLCAIVCLAACKSTDVSDSGNVVQTEIHQAYYMTYNEDRDETVFEAVFRFGGRTGTTLRLSGSSAVSINGQKMEGADELLQGFIYRSRVKGFVENGAFRFEDTGGKAYENAMHLDKAQLRTPPVEAEAGKPISVYWEGPNLRDEEGLVLQAVSDSGHTASIDPDPADWHLFIITPEIQNELGGTELTVSTARGMSKNLQQATHLGGAFTGAYEGKKYVIRLKKGSLQ